MIDFPLDTVLAGQDNVVTVLQDHMGNDEKPNEKSPRGIRGFQLIGGNFTTWKVQGKYGGYAGCVLVLSGCHNRTERERSGFLTKLVVCGTREVCSESAWGGIYLGSTRLEQGGWIGSCLRAYLAERRASDSS